MGVNLTDSVEKKAERFFPVSPEAYPFESRWWDGEGVRLHYLDERPAARSEGPDGARGSGADDGGAALLFLHGNPTWSYLYRAVIRELRSEMRCLAVDYPGFGYSRAPAGYGFRPQDHVRWVGRWLEDLDAERLLIVAHDWGGPIGLSLAQTLGDRVRGLVVANSWCGPPGWPARLFSLATGSRAAWPFYWWGNLFAGVVLPLALHPRSRTGETLRAYRAPFRDRARRLGTWMFPRALRSEGAWLEDLEDGLEEIRDLPVELVCGLRDPVLGGRAVRERWLRHFPGAHVEEIPDAGHYLPEDRPGALVCAVRRLRTRLSG